MALTLQEFHRGPTLKLIISMMCRDTDNVQKETNPIRLHNLALIIVKLRNFKQNYNDLHVSVKIKKDENAKVSLVPLTVTYENTDKQLVCCDEWVEFEVEVIIAKSKQTCTGNHNNGYSVNTFYLWNFELEFTAHATMPVETIAKNDLYEDTDFTDFQLQTADGAVDVHKVVLSQHSHMFKAMLRGGEWKETKQGHINLAGVTIETLQQLKTYMYLGVLPDEGLEPLLLIANHYFLDELKADCITKLIKVMKPESFDDLLELAVENKVTDLVKALLLKATDRFMNAVYQLKIKEQPQAGDKND